MHPALVVGLGYLAWQILQSMDERTEAECRHLERLKHSKSIEAHWDAWYAVRRLIAEFMTRKNEVRTQLEDLQHKRRSAGEIRELRKLVQLLSQKLSGAYAEKERIEAFLEAEDPGRFAHRLDEAARRTEQRQQARHRKQMFRRGLRRLRLG